MGFLSDIGSFIMTPLYYAISVLLVGFHKVFAAIFGYDSGAAWVLSIIGLTVVIRAALIPLFVKQINSSRNMQLLQPKMKELQKKYGHDRERLTQETMALYRETGTNPFSSCLPILVQMPIFLALFRLIWNAAREIPKGILTKAHVDSLREATVLGAKISDSFTKAESLNVQILAASLVIAMTLTTFLTQRQLMMKNMPEEAMTGQFAQQQKMLLYVLPVVFAVGGIAFPIGVLIYWTTSNLWTMGQQFYVIRNNPAPNTEAYRAKLKRDAAKAERKGLPAMPGDAAAGTDAAPTEEAKPSQPQRQQPKRQSRSQRKKGGNRPQPKGPTKGPDQSNQPDTGADT